MPFNILPSRAKLEDYYKNHAPRLRQEGLQLFADKMLAFRTELEVMENFTEKQIKMEKKKVTIKNT